MLSSPALLALLERGPAHGYTLKHDYDTTFAQSKPLAFGQVYSSLARFEKHGWAELIEVEAGDGPDRRRYRITPDGVQVVHEWVTTPQEPDVFANSTLYARVSVALLSGRDPQLVLDTQRDSHLTRMRELQKRRRDATDSDLLAITYELAHLDADLTWIEQAGTRLAQQKEQR